MGVIKVGEGFALFFAFIGVLLLLGATIASFFVPWRAAVIGWIVLLVIMESIYWSVDVPYNRKLNRWQKTITHKLVSIGSVVTAALLPLLPVAVWFWLNSLKFKKD
jgi:hypothetical protein